MDLTTTDRHHLAILARANGSPVYHADFKEHILRSLLYRNLIKQTPNGTYRITLLGLITHRRNNPK
jgi:uncharacterized protein YjhX (UPF0386 family)